MKATAAPPPPRPVKAQKKTHPVTALIALGFVGFVAYSIFSPSEDHQAAASSVAADVPPVAKTVFETTAQQVKDAYDTNEVAADDIFRGKTIRVKGTVEAIDKDFTDDVVINLATDNQFEPFRATMEKSEKPASAKLRKGQKVSIDCDKLSRIVGSPMGSSCILTR
jgi:hypothetical protein